MRSTFIVVIRKLFMSASKAGRPKTPKDKARAPGISFRLTPDESAIISTYLSRYGITKKTEFARKALLYVASNDIRIT